MLTELPNRTHWRARMPGRPELDAEYFDQPYLTAAVNICSAVGLFIGVWTAILLLGALHRGFARYWPFVLILTIDAAVNLGVRVARARRRGPTDGHGGHPGHGRRLTEDYDRRAR